MVANEREGWNAENVFHATSTKQLTCPEDSRRILEYTNLVSAPRCVRGPRRWFAEPLGAGRPRSRQSPMMTVVHPAMMTPPCAVGSPNRAAAFPWIRTEEDPATIAWAGPNAHVQTLPCVAAGAYAMSTEDAPPEVIVPPP